MEVFTMIEVNMTYDLLPTINQKALVYNLKQWPKFYLPL
jgi:hypothetical protein